MNNIRKKLRALLLVIVFVAPAALPGQTNYKWDIASSSTPAAVHTGVCAGNDFAKGIAVDGKGNGYDVGTFTGSNVVFGPDTLTSAGGADIFIQKVNNAGVIQWTVQGKGANDDDAKSVAVYPDGTGGVNTYVTGYFQGTVTFTSTNATTKVLNAVSGNALDHDMYIVKYDDAGVAQWAYVLGNATSTDWHIGYDIVVRYSPVLAGNCIWIAGSYMGTTSFGSSYNMANGGANQNGFLACYVDGATAPTGATWAVTMTSIHTCQTMGLDVDEGGDAYITGYFLAGTNVTFSQTTGASLAVAPNGGSDGFVAKYDPNGLRLFADNFGSTNASVVGTTGRGVAVAEDGSVYVVGSFTNTTFFWASANIFGYASAGGIDGFLMKLNSSCVVQYVATFGSTTDDYATRVAVDNCGQRCYVTGVFTGTCTFGTSSLVSAGNTDAFLGDFVASSGAVINLTRAGGTGADLGNDVSVNSVEDIQYCGSHASNPCTFSGTGSTNLVNGGNSDAFAARWDDSNWPALEITGLANYQGASVIACTDYGVGNMSGTNVNFGLSTITSNGTDIFLTANDKYANYSSFVRLTSGSATETSTNLISNDTFHYVSGSALTGTSLSTVTFVNNATNSYTLTAAASSAVLIKSDLSGNIGATGAWATSIRPNVSGATGDAHGEGVAYDSNGNVYFCGWFSGSVNVYNAGATLTGNAGTMVSAGGSVDIFVVKYTSSGQVVWKRAFGSSGGTDKAFSVSLDVTSSAYYITGSYTGTISFVNNLTSSGLADGFMMAGNVTSGAPVCDKSFGSAGSNDQGNDLYAHDITQVFVTGVQTTGGAVYIADYDMSGTSGNVVWSSNSGGGGSATGNDILLGQNGYVYASGYITSGTVTFGASISFSSPGAYVVGLTGWGGAQTWGSEYTPAKTCFALAQDTGYLNNDHGYITLIGGSLSAGSHAYLHKATEEGCEFSSRIGRPVEGGTNGSYTASAIIYPNPFSTTATLKLDATIDPAASPVSILIIDMTGRTVKRMDEITSAETTISAEGLVDGIYFYEVLQNGNKVSTGKMMINN